MNYLRTTALLLFLGIISFNCTPKENTNIKTKTDDMLKKKIAQFAPTEITYDSTLLNSRQKIVLEKLYRASKIIDNIFLEQVYSGNFALKNKLEKSKNPKDERGS